MRKLAAPTRRLYFNAGWGFDENCNTARSRPARVAGYAALTMGLMNFSSNSPDKSLR